MLLAMATGELSNKETKREKINEYVSKEWLSLTSVRVTMKMIKDELTTRYDIACLTQYCPLVYQNTKGLFYGNPEL